MSVKNRDFPTLFCNISLRCVYIFVELRNVQKVETKEEENRAGKRESS